MFRITKSQTLLVCATASFTLLLTAGLMRPAAQTRPSPEPLDRFDRLILANAEHMIQEGGTS